MKVSVPDHIESLVPYPPGKPLEELEREYGISGSIKLASNENPWGPSPKAVAAISKAKEMKVARMVLNPPPKKEVPCRRARGWWPRSK